MQSWYYLSFLFLSFLLSFFFYIRYTRISTLPPQNHRQNALAMLYSKGSAAKKKEGKKRKNSLDPPSPHMPPTSPVCTFMSNANKTKRGATVSGLMTGLTPSSPLTHLSRHLRTSRRFHILQIILLIVRSSFFEHSVDSSLFESFLKGCVVSWKFLLDFFFLFFFPFSFLFLRFA